jgi:N-acetylmuramoyl-L-alanine amidase
MIITIDPGHTAKVNAGVIKGYYEGDAMYKLGKHLADALAAYQNVKIYSTRGENENPTLSERGKKAIGNKSDVFISLHTNAVSDSEAASYVCGFYSVKRKSSEKLCGELVKAVTNEMEEETTARSKGALTKKNSSGSDYYGVIRHSVAGNSPVKHSFIIEHGFHTNRKECEFLMSEANLKAIARAEAKVLAKYFNLKPKETTAYNVEIGPFKDKNTAEIKLAELKKAGFTDAFIVKSALKKTIEQLAKEIINGDWGNGHATREKNLAEAGWLDYYSYEEIRNKVNELCK